LIFHQAQETLLQGERVVASLPASMVADSS